MDGAEVLRERRQQTWHKGEGGQRVCPSSASSPGLCFAHLERSCTEGGEGTQGSRLYRADQRHRARGEDPSA